MDKQTRIGAGGKDAPETNDRVRRQAGATTAGPGSVERLSGRFVDAFREARLRPGIVIQIQAPELYDTFQPQGRDSEAGDGCLSQTDADNLIATLRGQIKTFLPDAEVKSACVTLRESKPNRMPRPEATTIGVWPSTTTLPGDDREAVLQQINLFEEFGLVEDLPGLADRVPIAIYVRGALMRSLLADKVAEVKEFEAESSDIILDEQDATVTTTVTGRRVRRSGRPGRVSCTLRYVESLRPAGQGSAAPCEPTPPAIFCDTDRNVAADVLDALNPLIPNVGALGTLVESEFFPGRILLPRPEGGPLSPERAPALRLSYEPLRVKNEGDFEGMTTLAVGALVARRPCLLVRGPSTVTVQSGTSGAATFKAVAFDMREPRFKWAEVVDQGEVLATPLIDKGQVTPVRFNAERIADGGIMFLTLSVTATDADGVSRTATQKVQVSVPFVEQSPRPLGARQRSV
jgi:hypothetical protein